jgi:hypothetical protein
MAWRRCLGAWQAHIVQLCQLVRRTQSQVPARHLTVEQVATTCREATLHGTKQIAGGSKALNYCSHTLSAAYAGWLAASCHLEVLAAWAERWPEVQQRLLGVMAGHGSRGSSCGKG